jgi:hypothetical protein
LGEGARGCQVRLVTSQLSWQECDFLDQGYNM